MNLVSFNVNGLRAIIKKESFVKDISSLNPDVIGFQETKLSDDNPEKFPLRLEGYDLYETVSKLKKGYSGVGVLSKIKPMSVHYGLLGGKYDDEGRAVTLEFKEFYFIILYVPNSGEGLKRLDFRLQFQKDLMDYLKFLEKTKPIVVTGDMNVAKEEIDIKNPKANHLNAGFTDEERQAMRDLLKECHLVDSYRYLYPDRVQYSWWSYRFNARANNAGWRIDYFLVSESLKSKIEDSIIHNEIFGSDHCPIQLKIDVK